MSVSPLRKTDRDHVSRIPVPEKSTLPSDLRDLYSNNHDENWIQALSVNGDTARRFSAYFASLFQAKGARLPLHERELLAVIVSAENGCGLCEIHHTQALAGLIKDRSKAQRIALDYHLAPLTPREHALADFAIKVTSAPKTIGQDDFDALRRVGLDDADIVEALETSSWFNHTNRIFISLGVVPDTKFFDS